MLTRAIAAPMKALSPQKKHRVTLRELKATEIPLIFPLIQLLNPDMSKALFMKRIKAMMPHDYRAVAAFQGKEMVAVSGFWIRTRLWCGKQLDMDNFVVMPTLRRSGVGAQILAWIEQRAIAEKCELIVLDSYVQSHLTHRFYYRQGFTISGYHMTRVPGTDAPFVPGIYQKK